jgi:hypothetical protein
MNGLLLAEPTMVRVAMVVVYAAVWFKTETDFFSHGQT